MLMPYSCVARGYRSSSSRSSIRKMEWHMCYDAAIFSHGCLGEEEGEEEEEEDKEGALMTGKGGGGEYGMRSGGWGI